MTRLTNKPRRSGFLTVILKCEHTTEISVKAYRKGFYGKTQRCVFCGLQVVKRILTHEWHYRCNSCRHQYWGGLDEAGTYAKRDKHKAAHPTHYLTAVVFDRVTEDNKGTMFKSRRRNWG